MTLLLLYVTKSILTNVFVLSHCQVHERYTQLPHGWLRRTLWFYSCWFLLRLCLYRQQTAT